ncbi:MAG TPA: Glu/Leu/Phe/Val dehydrogenase dimerization domain-containing protein [Streptosporangiaceae bacterium]|nr:Glu/Leu/Phe/Val dehydrogenase dimerization domain-containing protein [Streptosporangiaceae bacterium]
MSWPQDDLGPARVVFLRLIEGVDAVVVLDNVVLGPAIGGVRMTRRADLPATEVARLARAMTLKNAAAGLPHGGGKSGIAVHTDLDSDGRERVMRAFALAIKDLVDYIPGPDMGTDETSMAVVHDEIGRCVGLPAVLGGIPLDELGATGYGVAVCADALEDAKVLTLAGATVVVQGFGAVGSHAALRLRERGAIVVAVSDIEGATYAPDGLDVAELLEFKRSGQPVGGFPGGVRVPRDDILTLACDIIVPAAQPDVFTAATARRTRAKVILQGANIPASPEAEAEFHRMGILSVPDIIANAGGVICASVEYRGGARTQAFQQIEEKIRANTAELLDRMKGSDLLPREAATQMAMARLRRGAAYRRRL